MSAIHSPLEKSIAFVVGITHNDYDVSTLKASANDAELITNSLELQGFDLIMETGFTPESLQGILKRLQNGYQTEDVRLLIYYPSFSIEPDNTEVSNVGLVTSNASTNTIESELIDEDTQNQEEDFNGLQNADIDLQQLAHRIKALEKEREKAKERMKEIENQRNAAVLQQEYAEKQRNRARKRTKKVLSLTRFAFGIGLIAFIAVIFAVFKNIESRKQKEKIEIKVTEAQRELRNSLITKRNELNDSLKILINEIVLFGKAQEYDFVENRYIQFNNTWVSIEKLNATIRDSIKLGDKFIDNFKWSVPPDEAYKQRMAALKSGN